MKRLLETLKSARWLEAALLAALICILIVCFLDMPQNSQASDTEKRMEHILSKIEGAGKVHVMIHETDEGISGIVAACSGADNIRIVLTMRNAISTLTGVDNSRIEIIHSGE